MYVSFIFKACKEFQVIYTGGAPKYFYLTSGNEGTPRNEWAKASE